MRVEDHFLLFKKCSYLLLQRLAKVFKKIIIMFYHYFRAATDVCWAVKMISSFHSIEICMHVIDNGNNEIVVSVGRKGYRQG